MRLLRELLIRLTAISGLDASLILRWKAIFAVCSRLKMVLMLHVDVFAMVTLIVIGYIKGSPVDLR